MKRRAAAFISIAISLSFLVLADWVSPTGSGWRALAAFFAFTVGLIEITRAVIAMRQDETDSGSVRGFVVGAAFFVIGLYLVSTTPHGDRLVAAGLIVFLSAWATAHFFPSSVEEKDDDASMDEFDQTRPPARTPSFELAVRESS